MSAEYAIEKLVTGWTDVLSPAETGTASYRHIDYPPLLDMLDDACRGNIGERSSGGSDPATRSLLNAEAHALREHIDGTVRAWIVELGKRKPERELKAAVRQLEGILHAHHAAGTIPDSEHARILGFFPRWCEHIWRLYDPPREVDLNVTCPNDECGQSRIVNRDGEIQSAMIAYYHRGSGLVHALCRACGRGWGPDQVALLGKMLGATQDEAVIAAAGL